MILLAFALLAFGITDLLCWSPEGVSRGRLGVALFGGVAISVGGACLAGMSGAAVLLVGVVAFVALAVWRLLPEASPGLPLAWLAVTVAALFAISGLAEPVNGELGSWYSDLAFPFVARVSADQFLLGLGAGIFLLATSNRVVRLVLRAAGTPASTSENTLRGGRLLGPMERIVIGAIVLAGDPAAAAVVIAAKGLLRFPEIRNDRDQPDQVTEYFLIGTFSSLLLATACGVAVLAAS